MKKIVIVILALIMTFLFISCGNIEIKIQDPGENEKEEQTEAENETEQPETRKERKDILLEIGNELDEAFRAEEKDFAVPEYYGYSVADESGDTEVFFYYTANQRVAALAKNGKLAGKVMIKAEDMDFVIYNTGREASLDNGVAVIRNEHYGEVLTIDFNSESYEHEYIVSEESTEAIIGDSPDKKYTLIKLNNSGGDISANKILLKNNETGEIRYLTTFELMPGNHGEVGFLKNGDIYEYSRETLKVYSQETLEVIFDINDNFKLGTMENGNDRWLYSFRRDPDDFTYTIVYAYFSKENGYDTWEEDGYDHYYTYYRIGFLDKDGNVLESYNTSMPVCGDELGYFDVSMRFSDDAITLVAIGNTEEKITRTGVFNMKTKYFEVQQ